MRYIEAKLPSDLDYIDLYCVSDIHRGHRCFNSPAWTRLLSKIGSDPHAYMMINGDAVEAALKSAKHGDPYRTMPPGEERRTLQEELKPVKDKVLLIQPGNHEARHKDSDENPLELVAAVLGLEERYSPISAVLDVSFGTRNGDKGKPTSFMIFAIHGSGGGRKPGGKMNRVQELSLIVEGCDAYSMGHVHSLSSLVEMRMRPDPYNKTIACEPVAYVVSGSFLDYGDYGEMGAYVPNAVSMPILRLYEKRRHDRHKNLDVILPTRIRS